MGIIIAILIFGIIVIFHEFGHFILAKKNGIRVNEFAVGMGPKLFGIKKGETEYALRLLPLGGACVMAGEDEEATDDGCFNSKSVWARMSVILAGRTPAAACAAPTISAASSSTITTSATSCQQISSNIFAPRPT